MAKKKKDKKEEAASQDAFPIRFKRYCMTALKAGGVILLVAVVGFLGYRFHYFICESSYFRLKKVEVLGVDQELKDEIVHYIFLHNLDEKKYNLIRLKLDPLRNKLQKMPKLRKVELYKDYPSTLKIVAQPRKGVILISGDGIYLSDADGVIMERLDVKEAAQKQFPVITGLPEHSVRIGSRIKESAYFKALDIRSALFRHTGLLYDRLSEMNIGPHGEINIVFEGGAEVRLGRKRPLFRLPELDAFLEEYAPSRRGLNKFQYVDLRFDKQIVYTLRNERIAER